MVPTENGNGPKLDQNMPLEDALSQLSGKGVTEGCVVDEAGKVIGTIALAAAVEAIRRPERSSQDLQYR
jgi:CBS domain containing-hemolysin-like protein